MKQKYSLSSDIQKQEVITYESVSRILRYVIPKVRGLVTLTAVINSYENEVLWCGELKI